MTAQSPQLQTVLSTALATYDSPRDKREALDDVLRSVCAVVDILRTERNNSAPINTLPSELLVQIFRSSATPRPSVSLLSVCRRWRGIAEDSPELCSNMDYKWRDFRKHQFLDQLKRSLRYLVINPKDRPPTHPLQFHVLLSVLQACPDLIELEIHLLLDVGAQELDGADIRELLVALCKHLRSPVAPIPYALSITVPSRRDDEDIPHLLVDVDREILRHYTEESLFRLNSHPPTAPALRQILVKILHTIPTANITHLNASYAYFSNTSWRVVLRLLPALQSVALSINVAGRRFCDTLAEMLVSVRDATPASSLTLPLPLLRRLTVHVHSRLPDELPTVAAFLDAFRRVLRAYEDVVGRRIECARFMGRMFYFTMEGVRVPMVDNWDDMRGLVDELVIDNGWY
ncbi:hypothetical protein C8F01DRAFT_1306502 [Mycena amicta]|nr:hypothetical protein C8F01DRAFT_1306502 [Mycena amicta]